MKIILIIVNTSIPIEGYTKIFEKLLNHKNIKVLKNFDYFKAKSKIKAFLTITRPIDRFFNYKYGKLDWRSVKFKKEIVNVNDFLGNSVVNFPELKYKFTRIHEPKHLHLERIIKKIKL